MCHHIVVTNALSFVWSKKNQIPFCSYKRDKNGHNSSTYLGCEDEAHHYWNYETLLTRLRLKSNFVKYVHGEY